MTIVTVQEHGASKGGKPKVKASGNWYFLGSDISQPALGITIEIREGSFTMGDTTFKTIEAWRPAPSNNAAPAQAAVAGKPPAGYVDEATLRFISNCVGSAITAQTIKEPSQISAWVRGARAAITETADGFDDKIPF
jgi:hypothetical protein